MSDQPNHIKRTASPQKAQQGKSIKPIEADRKQEKSKIASFVSSKPERTRTYGKD